MATSRRSATQPVAKSNGSMRRASGYSRSVARKQPQRNGSGRHRQRNIRSR